ncbi:MAG: peptide deformylase [Rickettsiales bacterium]|jgi:peptide deformylase|nr:peptide deformylase [Rickettsiales bacterium]
MSEMNLRFVGDPVLREKAAPVSEVNDGIRATLDKMERTMRAENGAGLAAPQVGVLLRMLVFADIGKRGSGVVYKIINPKIVSRSEKQIVIDEACLSIQGPNGPVFADVRRPESVLVEWTDETGRTRREEFGGYASRAIQHEMDHLDGILFIDYLSSAKREMVMRKVKKRKSVF